MQENHLFEYAIIRVVPMVEREEFLNAGVILYCRQQKFLQMKFTIDEFTVKAGQKVILNFENPDFMQHNFVLIKPGSMNKVGAAADALARDPDGAQKQYVPRIPEVLYFTKLLTPDDEVTLEFTAPSQPGDYPYVCTFPGHWRIMNGILRVTK